MPGTTHRPGLGGSSRLAGTANLLPALPQTSSAAWDGLSLPGMQLLHQGQLDLQLQACISPSSSEGLGFGVHLVAILDPSFQGEQYSVLGPYPCPVPWPLNHPSHPCPIPSPIATFWFPTRAFATVL